MDEEGMLRMLENPQVQSSMNEALQNPALLDMMIQQNPMLRDMGPAARQMMQSPEFRRMLTDPDHIRQMMQMQRAMGIGRPSGGGAFPAPGVTNTTPEENRGPGSTPDSGAAPPPGFNPFVPAGLGGGNPFAGLFSGGGNPFGANPSGGASMAGGDQPDASQRATGSSSAGDTTTAEGQNQQNAQNPLSFLNPAMFGGTQGQAGVNPFNPQQNPFLRDPAALSQMMQAMGGGQGNAGGADANPLAALLGGGFGAPSPPDNRPPEERYERQLHQLNEMGFFEFERNIEALRRTGGSVQGAVEYLLGNPS